MNQHLGLLNKFPMKVKEIEIDEDKELSIVVDGQRSETDL
jgi:hypothetical protein